MNSQKSTLFLLTGLLLVLSQATNAAKVCPKGKSYRHDLCYEVKDKPNGTKEIYPYGKSYLRDKTWVLDDDRVYKKGKSYKRDETLEIKFGEQK